MQSNLAQKIENVAGFNGNTWQGELWTSRQRQRHRLHYVVSYRASFKPELPSFFISHLLAGKNKNAVVLDPFGGRGTTIVEANLQGFQGIHNDCNPVSVFLARAKQNIPELDALISRTNALPLEKKCYIPSAECERLLPFFEEQTLNEIYNKGRYI